MTPARAGRTHPVELHRCHKGVREHLQGQTLSHTREARVSSCSPSGSSLGRFETCSWPFALRVHIPESLGALPLFHQLDPVSPRATFHFVHLESLPRAANVGMNLCSREWKAPPQLLLFPSFPLAPAAPRPIPSHPWSPFSSGSPSVLPFKLIVFHDAAPAWCQRYRQSLRTSPPLYPAPRGWHRARLGNAAVNDPGRC